MVITKTKKTKQKMGKEKQSRKLFGIMDSAGPMFLDVLQAP